MKLISSALKTVSLIVMLLVGVSVCGQTLQNFTLPDVRTGKDVSLIDFAKYKGIVIIFSSNECPYDEYYADRLKSLNSSFKDRVPFILVNSHVEPAESTDAMTTYLQRAGLELPYLADKKQVVLNNLGPRKTPEAFLLQNRDGQFSVVYHGAIDDNPQSADEVKSSYLKTSIEQMLGNEQLSTSEERPVGCSIRKAKD